jgi:hypothetical protein
MTVGKAIYYLLSNYTDLTDIVGTRIFPEVAEQDSALPFVIYSVISNEPSDTHEGPSKLDIAQVDVVMYNTDYSGLVDMGVAVRAALDRVTGTYNGVGVQSVQYTSEIIDFEDYSRAYVLTQSYDVRINRDGFEIAQGTPVTGANIIDLVDTPSAYGTEGQVLAMNAAGDAVEWTDAGGAINELNDVGDVNIDDPLDRQALVYDEATDSWINDGVGQVVIPIRNNSPSQTLNKGIIVAFAGTQGDRILVEPWDNASPSAYIVGVLSESLAGGADGHAQTYGEIRALDTSAYTLDAILYASGSGTFTTTPNSLPVATVTRVHANTGRIFVRLYVPGDHYRDRFRAEAAAAATAHSVAPAGMETYYTAQANGDGFYQVPGSDTARNEGDVVRRIIYWKAGAFAAINSGGFTEVALDDDSTYAELLAAIDDILNVNGAPITIYSTRQEVTPATGLLQEYPGAAAAYSLRLLDGDYAGAAIRVRRSGDNSEQDINFDSGGEVDRDAIANFCSPGDGFVKTWYDQSGNGNHATQTTTSLQPKIYDAATGVALVDIKASVYHNDQYLEFTGGLGISGTDDVSVFAVIKPDNNSTNYYGGIGDGFDTANFQSYQWTAEYGSRFNGGFVLYATNASTSQVVITQMTSGPTLGDSEVYINGSQQTSTSSSNSGTTRNTSSSVLRLGAYGSQSPGSASNCYNGYIQELIVYPTDQSANRTGIESNINDHYTIY